VVGQTPLHWVSECYKDYGLRTAYFLLENGADPSAVDSSGLTPLSCAIESRSDRVVRLSVARGADVGVLDRDDRERVETLCGGRLLN
jgi:ankyrin repeat protein